MNYLRILVASVFLSTALYADNPNPFAHPSLSLSGGVYAGVFLGGSVSFEADFPIAGGANENGGFIFSMGPRVSGYLANYSNNGGYFASNFSGSMSIALNNRFSWSFPVGDGFMGPYFDIRPSLDGYFLGQGILGFGLTGALGFQHYFTAHIGWKVEVEGGASFPLLAIPLPWMSAQAGVVFAF